MEVLDFADEQTQRAAILAVQKALRAGTLTRPLDCAWCGRRHERIEGHHPDYARPLMVVWLCRPCHLRHHAEYANEHRMRRAALRRQANRKISAIK